jgi:hypothetical protein
MNLTLANATLQDNVYSWEVSFSHYKIQSITVSSSTELFNAKYNDDVEQFIMSERTDSCPTVFSGDFSVCFFTYPPFMFVDVQDIQIELSNTDYL